MLVSSIAVLVGLAYLAAGLSWARLIFKQFKISVYKGRGPAAWEKSKDKHTASAVFLGMLWPGILVVGTGVLVWQGIQWLVTHDQEIPAETEQKIASLEKELFPKEPPQKRCDYCHSNCTIVDTVSHSTDCIYYRAAWLKTGKE